MKADQLIQSIEHGCYDATFAKLYSRNPDVISRQRERYVKTIRSFVGIYGSGADLRIYSAPGRTEIGGNHTDHNQGIVMAAAVNLDIIAVVAKNNDNIVRLQSEGFHSADSVDVSYLEPVSQEFGNFLSLIRGVAAGIVKRGGRVGGFDAYTTSDVLRGSGLSSSAAFEVCLGAIFNHEYNNGRFSQVELGMIGQFAENKFFGKPSGLMDQTACAVGNALTIDFKDPENPVVEKVPFDLESFGFSLVITDTRGSHDDLTDDYAAIRSEMESVADFFDEPVLRQVDPKAFYGKIPEIRKVTGDRAVLRAHHFFNECRRVPLLEKAITANRMEDFLALIIESGHSSFEYNQNAYSPRRPEEQGVSLGLAASQEVLAGKGAWRLQGGGFAGTIQAFVPNDLVKEYCEALEGLFGENACYVLSVRQQGAIRVDPDGDL